MAVDVGKSVTSRSILVGLLGVTIICAVEPYNSFYARGTHLVDSYLPIGAFFIILLIVLANVVLRKLRPGSEFTMAELIVIWCMMIVIEAIPYSGLVRYVFHAIVWYRNMVML